MGIRVSLVAFLKTRNFRVLILVGVIGVLCIVNQRAGHDWGDDFSLYLRQSQALVEGNVGEVLATTRITVQESSSHAFSPYSYPWGAPLLLSPVVGLWGLDYPKLKILETLFFAGFLVVFFQIVARRVGEVGGLVMVSLIGFSVIYVGATDSVLADFPYLFFVGLSLWWMDRLRLRGLWLAGPARPLIGMGLLLAFTFSIRREGVALFLSLAAVHGGLLWQGRSARDGGPAPRRRLATPYVTAAGFLVFLQLVLPTVVWPKYEGGGLNQIRHNLIWFRDILGEHIGLKDQGVPGWSLLGSHDLALVAFTVFLMLAVLGILVRLLNHYREDAPLILYLLAVAFIISTLPFHEGRYLFSITPLLVYFAYQGIASTPIDAAGSRAGSWSKRTRMLPGTVAAVFMMIFVVGNASGLYNKTQYRLAYDYPYWGPEHPSSVEMFDEVRSRTRHDEVVSFFRARSMNLYSDRQSLQLTNNAHLLARADWFVMVKNSTYVQVLLTDAEAADLGLTLEWENDRFVLWRVP
ncbi:MAG: hypothetical protein WD184_08480 [Acidimicrobiia bacterium]